MENADPETGGKTEGAGPEEGRHATPRADTVRDFVEVKVEVKEEIADTESEGPGELDSDSDSGDDAVSSEDAGDDSSDIDWDVCRTTQHDWGPAVPFHVQAWLMNTDAGPEEKAAGA